MKKIAYSFLVAIMISTTISLSNASFAPASLYTLIVQRYCTKAQQDQYYKEIEAIVRLMHRYECGIDRRPQNILRCAALQIEIDKISKKLKLCGKASGETVKENLSRDVRCKFDHSPAACREPR